MSTFTDSLMQRATSLLWDTGDGAEGEAPAVVADQETAVRTDQFDDLMYDMVHDAAPNLRKSIAAVRETHDYVEPAYRDLFQVLNQGAPLFKDKATMRSGYDANHTMMESLAQTTEVTTLRERTKHDEWNSAMAMMALEPRMREELERTHEAREQAKKAQEAAQAAQEALQAAMDDAAAGAEGADGALAQAADDAEAASAAAQQAQADLDAAAQKAGESMAQTAKDVDDDLAEQEQTAAGYGISPGELQRMPFEARSALTRKLNQGKMGQIAKLVGKFREYGGAERRRRIKGHPAAMYDVEFGRDIERMDEDDFVRLAIPELEELFWLDYAQGTLLQWVERGDTKAGQGPIVVVCDESYSMKNEVGEGTAEQWSKALSMSLADQARADGRDFIYIGFSSAGQVWVKTMLGGAITLDDTIDFVSHFFGGGTSYEAPLRRALKIVESYAESDKGQPDIVFITDDKCSVPREFVKEWQRARERLDLTVFGIQIGPPASATLKALSDKTIQLSALNATPEGMKDLYRNI